MILHLAQVEKRRTLQSPGRLQVIAVRGANGLWVRHKDTIPLPFDRDRLHEGVLVTLELSSKREILKLELATEEIVRALVNFSTKIGELKQEWEDIGLWRNSLQYQVIELEKRKEEYDRRDQMLRMQEEAIGEFTKTMQSRQ